MDTKLDVARVITTRVNMVKNLYDSCSGQVYLSIICGALTPCTTLPGIRQTDWRIWTMTSCVLDQLERVLLRYILIFHNNCASHTIQVSITAQQKQMLKYLCVWLLLFFVL